MHVEGCRACQQTLDALTDAIEWGLDASPGALIVVNDGGDEEIAMAETATVNGPDATPCVSAGIPSTIGGRFRILRSHARGGQGEVFIARDIELNREVALKQIQARYADRADSRSRFLLEAEVTGSLEHPGVIPVYGLGYFDDGRPFYAMRFIRGDSLKDAIAQFHQAEVADRDPVSGRWPYAGYCGGLWMPAMPWPMRTVGVCSTAI